MNNHIRYMKTNDFFSENLSSSDPEIAKAIDLELGRQRNEIELIASENIVSKAVMEAQGSVMTNKYPKVTQDGAIMVDASTLTLPKTLPLSVRASFLDVVLQTSNLTQAARRTKV